MNREEAKEVVQTVKGAYPAWKLDDPKSTIDVWLECLKEFSKETAITALYKYMDTEERTYAPQPMQIKKLIERMSGRGQNYCTMIYSRRTCSIRWQPEGSEKVFDIPVWWDNNYGCYTDEEGRLYADPNWE